MSSEPPKLQDVVERVCAKDGDINDLKMHLAHFPKQGDQKGDEMMSECLMIAVTFGRADCLDTLIKAGGSPNFSANADVTLSTRAALMDWFVSGDDSATPLYVAAIKGHADCVKRLLAAGAEVDARHTRDGSTPLFAASDQGHAPCVEQLLAADAAVEMARTSDGRTPLGAACVHGHHDCARLLCSAGADIDHHSNSEDTPLSLAFTYLQSRSAELRREACLAMLAPKAAQRAELRINALQVRASHRRSIATAARLARHYPHT